MEGMLIGLIVLSVIIVVLLVYLIVKLSTNKNISNNDIKEISKAVNAENEVKWDSLVKIIDMKNSSNFEKIEIKVNDIKKEINNLNEVVNNKLKDISNENKENYSKLSELINNFFEKFLKDDREANDKMKEQMALTIKELNTQVKETLNEFNKTTNESLKRLEDSLNNNLKSIREDNNDKLEKINITVSEKLEKTLEGRLKQSFDNVIEQIGGVNKAIGEIKGLASDVGSLKNVLTNVKTKGIVGEVILGNIIKEILTVEQYSENVATKKNSSDRVEFAVKMPGSNDDCIYLPIDSKLPLESYYKIKDGMSNGDTELIKEGRKELKSQIKKYAKDISEKYIDVPNTTDFAIMFLPIEGLYIEVLDLGIFEEIQRDYHINISGPTTLTALLNSLQMGFKTLVIQKKSADVFKLLGAVKTEFEKFAVTLEKTQKKVGEASDELDKLVGTRTRMIQSKLKGIQNLDVTEASEVLGIE